MEKIVEINRIIAEFEGRLFNGHPISGFGDGTGNAMPEMKYHTSWDWLWPVILKIRELGYMVSISGIASVTYNFSEKMKIKKEKGIDWGEIEPIAEVVNGLEIYAIYDLCVQFITWYNEQPNLHTTPELLKN